MDAWIDRYAGREIGHREVAWSLEELQGPFCCSLLQSVAVCCSHRNTRFFDAKMCLLSVAVCCSLLQSVAVCCSLLQSSEYQALWRKNEPSFCCSLLQSVAVCCSHRNTRLFDAKMSFLSVVVYCSLLQFFCCSPLQSVAVIGTQGSLTQRWAFFLLQSVAVCCSLLQSAAVRCSPLQSSEYKALWRKDELSFEKTYYSLTCIIFCFFFRKGPVSYASWNVSILSHMHYAFFLMDRYADRDIDTHIRA